LADVEIRKRYCKSWAGQVKFFTQNLLNSAPLSVRSLEIVIIY